MTDSDNILDIMILEFPEYKKRITMLYNQSSNFLEACEDYVICLEAVKKLESMNNPDKKEEIIDLKQAMDELGAEILSKI